MIKIYHDFYGCSATIKVHKNGSASLKVVNQYGKAICSRKYATVNGAKIAMGRMSDGWREGSTG